MEEPGGGMDRHHQLLRLRCNNLCIFPANSRRFVPTVFLWFELAHLSVLPSNPIDVISKMELHIFWPALCSCKCYVIGEADLTLGDGQLLGTHKGRTRSYPRSGNSRTVSGPQIRGESGVPGASANRLDYICGGREFVPKTHKFNGGSECRKWLARQRFTTYAS
jgi:hypothetical protein